MSHKYFESPLPVQVRNRMASDATRLETRLCPVRNSTLEQLQEGQLIPVGSVGSIQMPAVGAPATLGLGPFIPSNTPQPNIQNDLYMPQPVFNSFALQGQQTR